MRIVSGGTSLAQDRHQWGLGGPKCLEQSRHMLVLLGPLVSHTISTSEALVTRMPVPALAHALCCWGHLALTASTQKGFGVLRCLERSTLMLVLLGAPGWHNIDTIVALVRQGSSDSLGSGL